MLTQKHSLIHNKEKSSSMHLTEDWLDFKFPFIWNIGDLYGNIEWFIFKQIIKAINGISEKNINY